MNTKIQIKALSPALAQTYVDYLGGINFDHAPHWASCFCRYYHLECSSEEWASRTAETNQSEALSQIDQGQMHGFLAFDGDQCIGWCNANDTSSYKRLKNEFSPFIENKKAAAIMCFVIHPDYRGQGVAKALIRAAIDHFSALSYDRILALPFELKEEPTKMYRGSKEMFGQFGFEVLDTFGEVTVMALDPL